MNPFHNFQISRKIGFYETRIANILLAILLYSFEISGQIKSRIKECIDLYLLNWIAPENGSMVFLFFCFSLFK